VPCGQVGSSLTGHLAGGRYRASPSGEASHDAEVIRTGKHPIEEPVYRLGLGHMTDRVAGLAKPDATRASM
jgi:hypothetical protein